MTARSTFFQQLLHTRWRIFEVFLMLLACFCVSNQQTVGQSIHSNPCSAGGHTWRISCFLRGHAPSDKLRIHARQPHLHRVPRQENRTYSYTFRSHALQQSSDYVTYRTMCCVFGPLLPPYQKTYVMTIFAPSNLEQQQTPF